MLAELDDPYSRFIPPAEFASMLKYDVSGVGLNLGTAEEFVNKTVSLASAGWRCPRCTACHTPCWLTVHGGLVGSHWCGHAASAV